MSARATVLKVERQALIFLKITLKVEQSFEKYWIKFGWDKVGMLATKPNLYYFEEGQTIIWEKISISAPSAGDVIVLDEDFFANGNIII